MATADSLPAFNAFESQLRTLCLKEFPCGLGNWRSLEKKKKGQLSKKAQLDERYCITIKDYGAKHEKAETLEELVVSKTSPWNLDYSWSNEAKSLREIAVRSPWLIDERFVLSYFKTLRIIDKKVTDVDGNFLYFSNLEELTLTANYLRTVNSKNLPSKLKVLELCANQISNLADLCIQPPPLIHLGLGHNKLHMIDDYITGIYWPCVLSLDLSFNNLNDLLDIIRKLQTLPKLRNLLLLGNPLSLVPAYKGYTIDSLRKLDFLDDIPISADDRHKYKGLAKRKEFILDEAKMTFKVNFIKGVPMPVEMQFPDDQPEFPIVTRKYFVQFMYLEDSSPPPDLFDMMQDQNMTSLPQDQGLNLDQQSVRSGVVVEVKPDEAQSQVGISSMKNVNFAQEVETVHESTVPTSNHPQESMDQENFSPDPVQTQSTQQTTEGSQAGDADSTHGPPSVHLPEPGDVGMELVPPEVSLAPVDSFKALWEEEIVLDWWQVYSRDDLLSFRNFLRKGMDIKIMEEKVLSYPAPEPEATPQSSPDHSQDTSKGKAKEKKEEKKKETKPDKKDDKKKKKKGEPDVELQHMPPEYACLTTFHIDLEDFLENETEFETVFVEGGEPRSLASPVPSESPSKKNTKDKKDKKKPDTAKKGKDDKGGKKSPDKKGGKDKKGAPAPADGADDEPPPPPPPLEVHVAVRLHQWKTAIDSLKDDEPSQAPEPDQTSTQPPEPTKSKK